MDQQMLVQLLRQKALADANAQGHSLDNFAAIAQAANNPGLAQAAALAAKGRQSRHKPVQMGQQGFALPSSGQFVASPMYEQERDETREAQRQLLQDRLADREQGRVLQRTLAEQAEQGRNERAAQDRVLRMTLGELSAANRGRGNDALEYRKERDAEREANRQADLDERKVRDFGVFLEKEGLPEFDEALQIAETTLDKYKGKNIPGYGRLEGWIPDALEGDEAQNTRASLQQAANILLKARSGAAVTEPEMQRFLRELAAGKGFDESVLRSSFGRLRQVHNNQMRNALATVPDNVLGEYSKRTGRKYDRSTYANKDPKVDSKPAASSISTTAAPPRKPAASGAPASAPKRIRFDAQGNELP